MSTHRAILYRETGEKNEAQANILTRGSDIRVPGDLQTDKDETFYLDVHCGQMWVSDMPDLTKHNEAYLEITILVPRNTSSQIVKVPYQFKLQVEVEDNSFCTNIAGAEILSGIHIEGNGMEFQCRLTELDKVDQKKFHRLQGFLEQSDISSLVTNLLAVSAANIPVTQLFRFISNTSEIIDEINDDDRLWLERPKLDLRKGTANPLYAGWYAFVDGEFIDKEQAPLHLYEMNGELYTEYQSDSDYQPLSDRTYFTWQLLKS